ncbi:L-seryl-tRNA(Sec) selenium transferase [bacterium]|nr:L-seryl-tRNA(Sec) selenium transferase [bacterium]
MSKDFSKIPSVSVLLEESKAKELELTHKIKTKLFREAIEEIRKLKNFPETKEEAKNLILESFRQKAEILLTNPYKKMINATGIILHTGLGRAVFGETSKKFLNETTENYACVEFDPANGNRGDRQQPIQTLLKTLTNCEASLVVNNNAAAVMLVLNTFAKNKEAIVSRGELVEIGGSFRMPEIMELSNAKMVEVGSTNKTHLKDYEKVISKKTGLLVKVHTSNFRVLGFTKEVSLTELVSLGKSKKIPVYYDLGSGMIFPPENFGLGDEPTIDEILETKTDLVSFSGDKILGSSQCGIILGKKELIEKMSKNPLLRAFRPDKMTLSVLAGTLSDLMSENVFSKIPTLKMLSEDFEQTKQKTEKFLSLLDKKIFTKLEICKVELEAEIGSGAFPIQKIKSFGVSLQSNFFTDEEISKVLLKNFIASYKNNGKVILNFKTVSEEETKILAVRLRNFVV